MTIAYFHLEEHDSVKFESTALQLYQKSLDRSLCFHSLLEVRGVLNPEGLFVMR